MEAEPLNLILMLRKIPLLELFRLHTRFFCHGPSNRFLEPILIQVFFICSVKHQQIHSVTVRPCQTDRRHQGIRKDPSGSRRSTGVLAPDRVFIWAALPPVDWRPGALGSIGTQANTPVGPAGCQSPERRGRHGVFPEDKRKAIEEEDKILADYARIARESRLNAREAAKRKAIIHEEPPPPWITTPSS
jgi:hypothetical protein